MQKRSIPAYEGDTVEGNSVIYYAIDLDGATDVQLEQYSIVASAVERLNALPEKAGADAVRFISELPLILLPVPDTAKHSGCIPI